MHRRKKKIVKKKKKKNRFKKKRPKQTYSGKVHIVEHKKLY